MRKPCEECSLACDDYSKRIVGTSCPDFTSPSSGFKPKKEDLIPTMRLRLLQSNRNEINPPILQQWWLDRNVVNKDGTAGGGCWVDVPLEIEG